ncbi:dTDP-4-dehydrorhamnose reductase [Pelistega indica]|uniref:dTDP-4-dehydrorhamnose reductase n=1 Tax=Pelistega indica TaxID=1414851 RepID=V8G906_9BURK|nr:MULTISPECIES: dTDP-4-dehydrorhamnose reductase [Pelistega]ETD72182.1 dTDP-4-dehydrorhamnose reductase [Pelistega indica]
MVAKALLFGSNGQLGKTLIAHYQEQSSEYSLDCLRLDKPLINYPGPSVTDGLNIADLAQLCQVLNQHQPSLIINAAAYTNVDKAEIDREKANVVNAEAVKVMAEWAAQNHARLCHFSTDYVMSGLSREPLIESYPHQPMNYYGYTKSLAEQYIQQSGCEFLIIRTSWLYSQYSPNFVLTMAHLLRYKQHVFVVDDQWGVPTSATFVSRYTLQLLQAQQQGIYHVVPSGYTSWYEFALKIRLMMSKQYPELTLASIEPISSRDYAKLQQEKYQVAERPRYAILSNTKLATLLAKKIPDWTLAFENELRLFKLF